MSQNQNENDPTPADVPPTSPEVFATGQLSGNLGVIPDALEETIIATAVRLLRVADLDRELSPVETAIFKGAAQMFEELAASCRELSGGEASKQRGRQKSARTKPAGGLQ
jgi:hypothetical protein